MNRFITVILIFFLCLSLPLSINAATVESVNQQISDINAQIKELDREINQYQQQVAQTSEQAATLANLIKELTLTRSKLLKETQQTEKKINATSLVIGEINNTITTEQKVIADSKEALRQSFRRLYQYDETPLIQRLLSKDSIAEASQEYNNLITLNDKVDSYILLLENKQVELASSKKEKESEQQNLTQLKQTLQQKKLAVDVTKKEKDTLLSETKNKESNYLKLLADRQKKRDAFEKALEDYEAQLKFILNPSLLPKEGSAVLSWPLDNIFITQLFGKTVSSKRLYVSGSHSGVDFRASIGTPVKSMASGTVVGTGDTDLYCKGASFGKWVFIKYNNGLSSTFGHLSVITSKAGDQVSTGDVVALSGNTGHSTGPHLHVAVYASQGAGVDTVPSISCSGKTFIMPIAPKDSYLDPMLYLPSVSKSQIKEYQSKD